MCYKDKRILVLAWKRCWKIILRSMLTIVLFYPKTTFLSINFDGGTSVMDST